MYCKVCGTKIGDDAKRCSSCRTKINSELYRNAKGYCVQCGAEIIGDTKYCPFCATVVGAGPMKKHEKRVETQKYEPTSGQGNQLGIRDFPSREYFWWGLLFPFIGLVLYLAWKYNCPMRADSAKRGMIIGIMIGVLLYLITFLIQCSAVFMVI